MEYTLYDSSCTKAQNRQTWLMATEARKVFTPGVRRLRGPSLCSGGSLKPIPHLQHFISLRTRLFSWAPKSLQMVTAVMKLKTLAHWKKSYDQPRQHIKNQGHYFTNKGPSSQSYGFSSSQIWMWELDHKESWVPKNWCFWTVVLENKQIVFRKEKKMHLCLCLVSLSPLTL